MGSDSDQNRLEELASRIKKAKADQKSKAKSDSMIASSRRMIKGARVVSDFVAVIVGSGLVGFMIDRWLETAPWFMLILLSLGFVVAFWMLIGSVLKKKAQDKDTKDE